MKKDYKGLRIFSLFLIWIMFIIGCQKQPIVHVLKYEVVSSLPVNLTYIDQYGETQTKISPCNEFKYLFESDVQNFYYISAESQISKNSVILRLYLDGEIIRQSTLYGIGKTKVYFKL